MRAAQLGLVFRSDDTVAVDIDELQVAGLNTGTLERVGGTATAVLAEICLQVALVLDDALCLIAIEIADGVSFLHTCHVAGILCDEVITAGDELIGILHLGHFVLILGKVDIDTIFEIADVVLPSDGSLNTGILHGTCIGMVSILSDDTPQRHPKEQVLGLFVVPLEGGGEAAAEEACIETHVGLL